MLMICFLPVSASFSGDGASSVGRAPSLGPHKGDLLLQGKVMLGREGGGRTPSWSLEEQVNPAQCLCPSRVWGLPPERVDGDSGWLEDVPSRAQRVPC